MGSQRRHEADDGRFLAQVEVAVAADERLGVGTGGAFLETADEQHVPVELAELPVAGHRPAFWAAVRSRRARRAVALSAGGACGADRR